ncbi:MAG: segregation/condensation protein A [Planctomycetota bacterium]|nr:segregation/condensation protein A [Planctomycetota bacterium]
MRPLQEDYQITIDTFQGPLDLLLYLIRRAEVDILDIPIAAVTVQFLEFLKQLDYIDIDNAGDFLVMASSLVEIKSRSIAPPSESATGEGGNESGLDSADPRYELVQQLLAYQRYRIASDELEQRRLMFLQRYPILPDRKDRHRLEEYVEPIELELDDLHILDLSENYERIVASIDFTKLGEHTVEIDDTPIALHQEDLLDRLEREPDHRLTLHIAYEGAGIGKRIGLFMATLELVRLRRVTVIQDDIDSPIELVLNTDPDEVLVIDLDEITLHHNPDGTHIDPRNDDPQVKDAEKQDAQLEINTSTSED